MSRVLLPGDAIWPHGRFPARRASWVVVVLVLIIGEWTPSQAAADVVVLLVLTVLTLVISRTSTQG
jgi:hypothetical protein